MLTNLFFYCCLLNSKATFFCFLAVLKCFVCFILREVSLKALKLLVDSFSILYFMELLKIILRDLGLRK
jgi:hypothetical protein